MKNVLIFALLLGGSLGMGYAQESEQDNPKDTIVLSDTDKYTLASLQAKVLQLQLELSQLEKAHTQKTQQLQALSAQFSQKVDETVLQYIKESEREDYTFSEDLNLVPNE